MERPDPLSPGEQARPPGSYRPDDIEFLLERSSIRPTPIEEKERLIQSGQRHYSEMISLELPPDSEHERLFEAALERGGARMAREVMALAGAIDNHREIDRKRPLLLLSLVRAGAPLGVLLRRALKRLGRECHHYGISIIRDRGIDHHALMIARQRHPEAELLFVDGWSGKGAIAGQLERSLAGGPIEARLVTLADPCGVAWLSASGDDWLIPSGILGATISGLISRTLWSGNGLHHCLEWHHLQHHDRSRQFVDRIEALFPESSPPLPDWSREQRQRLANAAGQVIDRIACDYRIDSRNRIKPGIAEATRAVLRRVPDRILVRDRSDDDLSLLLHLADRHSLQTIELGDRLGPYRAVTIIKKVL
jgi:hypothetical protein